MTDTPPVVLAADGQTIKAIRGLRPSLIPSETRVADALLIRDQPLPRSVAELAARADVSPATVVRACQSFGFQGFIELMAALARDAQIRDLPEPPRTGAFAAAQRMIRAGVEQLESMAAMLDRDVFERAVETIADARRVLMVSGSDLAFLGHYAVFRFAMIGRSAEAPTDVITAHAVADGLGPEDVCVAIGHTGTNNLTLPIAGAASLTGATVIAITSFARGPLADLADLHLVAGVPDTAPSDSELTRVRVSQMMMIDALQAALAGRGGTLDSRVRMDRTLSHYVYRRPRHARAPRDGR